MDGSGRKAIIRLSKKKTSRIGCMEMEDGKWSKGLRKTKNLKKCDYGWMEESHKTNADVRDTCMVPSVQIGLRY